MARAYSAQDIRKRMLDILSRSSEGIPGTEIATKLGISRITTAKYLAMFSSQGMIRCRDMGNVSLWSINDGAEIFRFPDDYYRARTKLLEGLQRNDSVPGAIIQSCLNFGAPVTRIMIDVVLPVISSVRSMYDEAKMGDSERGMIEGRILNCIKMAQQNARDPISEKNIVLISADGHSLLKCHCAEAAYRSCGWRAYNLGDMSSSVMLFDIDLPKFLSRVWRSRRGIMIVAVLSQTEEGLNFFADAVGSSGVRRRGGLYLALCGRTDEKAGMRADIVSEDLGRILQWSETVYERHGD